MSDLELDGPSKKRKLNGVHQSDASKYPSYHIIRIYHFLFDTLTETIALQEARETADEKRLRLAQDYLDRLGAVQNDEDDRPRDDIISHQLEEDAVSFFLLPIFYQTSPHIIFLSPCSPPFYCHLSLFFSHPFISTLTHPSLYSSFF
jgi:hypothetical protein